VQRLAESAEQLGAGGIVLAPEPTGVAEFDVLGETLASSSARIAEALARERAFSADVSHQLRTPLTGLRLMLESEPTTVEPRALAEVDRLQRTVDDLLALSRDRPTGEHDIDVADTVRSAGERWTPLVAAHQRNLIVDTTGQPCLVRASATAIGQIIDVLVDNAVTHGAGTIRLTYRRAAGGIAIDVSDDDGPGVALPDSERIFQRGHGTGHGLGLTVARSLAEGARGRLLLTNNRPARFTVFIPSTAEAPLGVQHATIGTEAPLPCAAPPGASSTMPTAGNDTSLVP
jgi:signal transduction histidine kinase